MKTKEQKRKEASERQAAYDKLTLEQKLVKAGAKERAKLLNKMEQQNERKKS